MAPVATNDSTATNGTTNGTAKAPLKAAPESTKLFNPFYSPTVNGDGNDADYKYANYKVRHRPALSIPAVPRRRFVAHGMTLIRARRAVFAISRTSRT